MASSSIPAAASTTGSVEKTSGRWTNDEVKLLLGYVEANCILTTARGLNLKKSDFNKAHNTVKTKDPSQCGDMYIYVIDEDMYCLLS